jgi:hypothetical protein
VHNYNPTAILVENAVTERTLSFNHTLSVQLGNLSTGEVMDISDINPRWDGLAEILYSNDEIYITVRNFKVYGSESHREIVIKPIKDIIGKTDQYILP